MLKKELTISGVQIQVNPTIKNGVDKDLQPFLTVTADAGSVFDGCYPVYSGDVLTVVRKPRKTNGINTVIVETATGVVGHVYWCELRVSCKHI